GALHVPPRRACEGSRRAPLACDALPAASPPVPETIHKNATSSTGAAIPKPATVMSSPDRTGMEPETPSSICSGACGRCIPRTFPSGGNMIMRISGKSVRLLFAGALLALFAGPLAAATYYVDQKHPNASDNNPGTAKQPWLTLRKAMQTP